jgi:hypothetical protein
LRRTPSPIAARGPAARSHPRRRRSRASSPKWISPRSSDPRGCLRLVDELPGEQRRAIVERYVEERSILDAAYQRAIDAGATSIGAPADQPFGVRLAGVQDPFGNLWYVARQIAARG